MTIALLDLAATANSSKDIVTLVLQGLVGTILLLMPGYLLGIAYGRGLRGPAPSERVFVANAAVGSVVVHLLALAWTLPLATAVLRDGPRPHTLAIAAWASVVLVVVPVVLGASLAMLARLRTPAWAAHFLGWLGLSATVRIAEAWNWTFSQQFPAYVRIRLKDDRIVLGWYGANSFASSDAAVRDLYVEQEWISEDGWFKKPYPATGGIWLNGSDIMTVEFFVPSPSDVDESTESQNG